MNNPRFYYSTFAGNWEYDNQKNKVLDLKYINDNLLSKDRLQTIKLKEIAWKSKHHFPYNLGKNCICCGGKAYINCDPSIPGIIAYNCPNPYDNKYRMLDGRHRIMRLLFEGKTESKVEYINGAIPIPKTPTKIANSTLLNSPWAEDLIFFNISAGFFKYAKCQPPSSII